MVDKRDLVLLVADKNMQFALHGALERPAALGMRPISFEIRTHLRRDGGVRKDGPEMLALEKSRFAHALLVMDFEGSGAGNLDAAALESDLDKRLQPNFGDKGKAIVIEPELDIWMWGSDRAIEEVLRWPLQTPIRDFLQKQGFELRSDGKPRRPKEALEALIPIHKMPRSSALYEKIAGKISLDRCTDPAFGRLKACLLSWFGQR
jgi:hypothetical protein